MDTSIVFPHRLGPPYKRALRNLMADYLEEIIQDSGELWKIFILNLALAKELLLKTNVSLVTKRCVSWPSYFNLQVTNFENGQAEQFQKPGSNPLWSWKNYSLEECLLSILLEVANNSDKPCKVYGYGKGKFSNSYDWNRF